MAAQATPRLVPWLAAPWLCALSLACGGASPAPQPQPSVAAEPAPPEVVASEPDGPTEPYSKVQAIQPGKDDPADRRAHIEFFNPTKKPCTFTGYTLTWSGGSKTMPLDDFTIEPASSRQRYLILHPSDGDLSVITAEGAKIELEATCAR